MMPESAEGFTKTTEYSSNSIEGLPEGVIKSTSWFTVEAIYERDFISTLSDNYHADVQAFNSTSRYLDDLLNIDNPSFKQVVSQRHPTELQLIKTNSSYTEAPALDGLV